jgi:hypothetical protein
MIKIPPTVTVSMIDDELVLMDEVTGKYFGLNPVASRMFGLLGETGDFNRTVDALQQAFAADRERLSGDLRAFIDDLAGRGLLTTDES